MTPLQLTLRNTKPIIDAIIERVRKHIAEHGKAEVAA